MSWVGISVLLVLGVILLAGPIVEGCDVLALYRDLRREGRSRWIAIVAICGVLAIALVVGLLLEVWTWRA